MKNSINLCLIILFLLALGCSCPKLSDLANKGGSASPTPSSSSTPASNPTPSTTTNKKGEYDLTLAKFNQLKDKMPKDDVDRILGGPGNEISKSTGGGVTFSVFKWQGSNSTSVIISFREDRIMTKYQVGLK